MTAKREKTKEADVTGLKYFKQLAPLFERLHDDACERDKAGNRDLHFDQYCMLVLLFMFNPVVSSLRAIQQASELKKVQRKLGCKRASLGSLSEASRVFNPELLREVIKELGEQLQPVAADRRLANVPHTITAVDGSLLAALPLLVEAMQLNHEKGSGLVKWRLHAQFEIEKYVPTRIDVTRNGGGENDERAVLERTLESNRCYVRDRGYAKFALFNAIVAKRSSYVCRIRDNSKYEVVENRPLSDEAGAADVLEDAIVEIGKTGKADGIEIQTYCAIIACMLISLWTGRKPTLRTYEMICYYFTGLADEEELIAHLEKLQPQDQ